MSETQTNSSAPDSIPTPVDTLLPTYTRAQLALRNGQDRDEIWVAYQGNIYDVSRSRLWRRGNHYEHWAGQDLTRELDHDAPHTPNVFDNFPIIGKLAASSSSSKP
ncbi:cytochrome b5 [Hymenobacter defluvii]|uniref:Cytochrome b5 n=1 Tax=Hymenobacter defluvii TaxID=2054411 RepID=A0ABS3T9M0_9BACT|nr:cytochrome b5 [Hymenobacter defluvii]